MEQMKVYKQMIQMNKMAFDNSYNMMMSAFEQNKLMLNTLLNQPSVFPQEGKKAVEKWLENYRAGCENLKKMADDGYSMLDKYISQADK